MKAPHLMSLLSGQEMVGPRYRICISIAYLLSFMAGELAIAGVASLLRTWNYLLIVISVALLPFMVSYW